MSTIRADEMWTVLTDVAVIDLTRIGRAIEIAEVFGRTTDDGGKAHVLFKVLDNRRNVGDVALAEVDVVIEKRASIVSCLQKGAGMLANDGIDGEEGAEDDDVL